MVHFNGLHFYKCHLLSFCQIFKCYFTTSLFEKLRGNFYILILVDTKSSHIGSLIPIVQTSKLRLKTETEPGTVAQLRGRHRKENLGLRLAMQNHKTVPEKITKAKLK
jgi:hypothetical protein